MHHASVDISLNGDVRTYRLPLAQIEELEEQLDMSLFLIAGALSAEIPFLRVGQWKHVLRLGLIGGGLDRASADMLTDAMIEDHGPAMCLSMALRIVGAAVGRVHGDGASALGEGQAPTSSVSTSAPSTQPLQ